MKAKTVRVKLKRDGAMCHVPVPFDPKAAFGKVRAPVTITLNRYTYRSTIFSMGGDVFIPLRQSHREAAGLQGDETLTVKIALDVAAREVEVPEDLAKALRSNRAAAQRWDALSYTHRREYADAIAGARKPETRARRIEKTLHALANPR